MGANETDLWLAGLSAAFDNFDREESVLRKQQTLDEAIRVPRIPYDSITSEDFAKHFSATNTPIILGDAFDPIGPVPQHLTAAYFKQNFRDALVP